MLLSLCDDCYCCCSLARFCTSWSVLSAISHRSRLSISLQSLRWLRQTNMRVMKIHIDFYLMCSVIVYTKTHTDYVHLFCFKNGKMKQFEPNESAAKAAARKRIPHTHTKHSKKKTKNDWSAQCSYWNNGSLHPPYVLFCNIESFGFEVRSGEWKKESLKMFSTLDKITSQWRDTLIVCCLRS